MPTGHRRDLKQARGSLVHLINDNQRRLHRSTSLRLIPCADLVRELAESDALKLTPTIDRSADAVWATRKSTASHNVNSSHDLSAPKVLSFLQHADVINIPVSLNNFPFIIPPDSSLGMRTLSNYHSEQKWGLCPYSAHFICGTNRQIFQCHFRTKIKIAKMQRHC